MTDHPRYRIEQGPDGRFRIVHSREPEWTWNGEHWSEMHALAFASADEAATYARSVFKGEPTDESQLRFPEGVNL